jgi:ubiquinone biosynthesis monooxygenase Coq7
MFSKLNIKKKLSEIIRVNHAGEYGAVQIYSGQLKAFAKKRDFEILPEIEYMKQQEMNHLQFFNKKLIETQTLSTIFLPLWHCLSYGMGYISAKMGDDFAMTCTESVEKVIDKHYAKQIDYLDQINQKDDEGDGNHAIDELKNAIVKFRDEEIEHMDHAIKYKNELYQSKRRKKMNDIFGKAVKITCKAAIAISKKI